MKIEVQFNEIGKNIYGVQIADQYNRVFYRFGIITKVSYPSIPSNQIETLKFSKNRMISNENK